MEQNGSPASPRARQAKDRRRNQRYEELLAKSRSRVAGVAEITIRPVRAWATWGRGEACARLRQQLLIDDLSFKLPPGGIVGVIDRWRRQDHAVRMIIGQERRMRFAARRETVKLGYVDQSRDSLNSDNTVWQEISGGEDMIYSQARRAFARLCRGLIQGFRISKKVGILSGGERNRVHLAKMLKTEHTYPAG